MYKEELINLHQFLLHICRFLEDYGAPNTYFEDYEKLGIGPHHIHKRKVEHKHVIFVLSHCISKALAEHDILPKSIPKRFEGIAVRCKEGV